MLEFGCFLLLAYWNFARSLPIFQSVNDAFELLDPGNAQIFLKKFSPEARRLGQKCLAAGCVHSLNPDTPGKFFSAEVHLDKEVLKVQLYYDPVEGWMGDCTCPLRTKCPHIFAAMRSLLAENSSAVVRNLSASRSTGGAGVGIKGKTGEEPGLARRLLSELGRPLNPEESKYIRKVSATYE